MKKSVVLIGFMGSGKTAVARRLSQEWGIPMEDTDHLIEQRENRSINEIFRTEGETYFRERETELLKEIASGDDTMARILSVGGGTPVRKENRELLKQCGTVVYLQAEPETLYERLKGDTTRPLLLCDDPLSRIRELLEGRKEAYEESADVVIGVDGLELSGVMDRVRTCLKGIAG